MGGTDSTSISELYRADPVGTGLLVFGPVVVAVVQLANSVVNGLSLMVAVPFAAVLLAFAGLNAQHQAARHRTRELHARVDHETASGDHASVDPGAASPPGRR